MKIILSLSLLSFSAFANTTPASGLKYSANQMNHNEKAQMVELVGNAKVSQGEHEVIGDKIILNLRTGVAQVTGNARHTAQNLTVTLSTPKRK